MVEEELNETAKDRLNNAIPDWQSTLPPGAARCDRDRRREAGTRSSRRHAAAKPQARIRGNSAVRAAASLERIDDRFELRDLPVELHRNPVRP